MYHPYPRTISIFDVQPFLIVNGIARSLAHFNHYFPPPLGVQGFRSPPPTCPASRLPLRTTPSRPTNHESRRAMASMRDEGTPSLVPCPARGGLFWEIEAGARGTGPETRAVNVGRITLRNAELPRRPIARDRPKNSWEVVAMQSPELSRAGAGGSLVGRTLVRWFSRVAHTRTDPSWPLAPQEYLDSIRPDAQGPRPWPD